MDRKQLMIGAIIVALAILAGGYYYQAKADTPAAKWSGCYVGVQGGYGATHHDTSINVAGTGTPLDGSLLDIPLSSQGGLVGMHAGCDMQVQQIVFGIMGDYNWQSQTMEINSPVLGGLIPGINPIARLAMDTSWTVAGRAGLVVAPNTLVYGLVGWTRLDTGDLTLVGGNLVASVPTMEGWTFGGGVDVALTPNIRLGAQYRYTHFDKSNIAILSTPGGSLSLGAQPDMHTVQGRLSYQFNLPN